MKKWIAMVCFLLLVFPLSACGSSSNGSMEGGSAASTAAVAAGEAQYISEDASSTTDASSILEARKIIRTTSMNVEALNFDEVCATLLQQTEEAGGYVASSDVSTPSYEGAMRSAVYELRIPSEKYSDFLSSAEAAGNVTNLQESVTDITSQYVDVEARLESLRLQQERLYELMEQAANVETLLAVQNELTEVQYQIESYTAQQRTYDQQVAYSTITVYVYEVQRITEKQDTFGQRLSAAFSDSWYHFAEFFQEVLISLAAGFPFVLIAVIVCLFVVRAVVRKRRKKKLPPPQAQQNDT